MIAMNYEKPFSLDCIISIDIRKKVI
jgi:hypothetical protein